MPKKLFTLYPELNDFPELRNPALFSPTKTAQRVLAAVMDANRGDKNTARFAIRASRAVTLYEEGFHNDPAPLFACLLYGRNAPLRDIAYALGESFIGKPLNGIPAVTLINCSQFPFGHHPFALAQLTGPEESNGTLPRLWDGSHLLPDVWSRAGYELLPIENLRQEFRRRLELFGAQYGNLTEDFSEIASFQLTILQRLLNQAKQEIEDRFEPFRSVIVFDHIEQGSPELIERVIHPIIKNGSLPPYSHFNNSVVILTMHDPYNLYGKHPIGFVPSPYGSGSKSEFIRLQKQLLRDPLYDELCRDLGDNILIISQRRREAQEKRCDVILAEVRRAMSRIDIQLVFRRPFRTFLLEKSQSGEVFSARLLEDLIQRYVELPLAQAVASGKLYRSTRIIFSGLTQDGLPKMTLHPRRSGGDSPPLIQKRDIETALKEKPVTVPETEQSLALRAMMENVFWKLETLAKEALKPKKDTQPENGSPS